MFEEFVGQEKIIKELSAIIAGLRKYPNKSVNIILRGPAGCGKTRLAEEFAGILCERYGYQVPSKGFSMKGIKDIRCQIMDEIHTMRAFENLYPLMDEEKYVFIFCTTEFGDLPDPFSSRCLQFTFISYSIEELAQIAVKYSQRIKMAITFDTGILVAKRAKGSPRRVEKLVQRMFFIIDRGYHPLTIRGINAAMNDIGVYNGGYTDADQMYLKFLAKVGKASLNTICRAIRLDENTIKNEIEPFLVQNGHISITSKGRQFLSWEREGIQ